ncbi:hypothetical protein BH20ACI3_BH20ACI3_24760 [soil metagenome]
MGRFDEAIAEGRRAEQLDPFSPVIGADLGTIFGRARRFDEAIAQLNRVLTVVPNFHVTHYYLGIIYHAKGNYAEAVAEYRKALALNADPWVKAQLARSLARLGQRDEATKLLGELQSASARRYVSSASLALIYGALGVKTRPLPGWKKRLTSAHRVLRCFLSILSGMIYATTRVLPIWCAVSPQRKWINSDEPSARSQYHPFALSHRLETRRRWDG